MTTASPEESQGKPAMIATLAALLEASSQESAALDMVSQIQASLAADKQKSKAEKAAISKGLLPIVARLQLKVTVATSCKKRPTLVQTHGLCFCLKAEIRPLHGLVCWPNCKVLLLLR